MKLQYKMNVESTHVFNLSKLHITIKSLAIKSPIRYITINHSSEIPIMHSSTWRWIEMTVQYGKTKSNVNFVTEQNYIRCPLTYVHVISHFLTAHVQKTHVHVRQR